MYSWSQYYGLYTQKVSSPRFNCDIFDFVSCEVLLVMLGKCLREKKNSCKDTCKVLSL